ncbi:LamG domain-containing protein [Paraflavitalea pollutisoli]|uniref:LamG domain-containing protein n=1 Tax=Paraflavitalea pollutisoli TaxID=3034143 RepID=UPI0023EB8807|nr:LamG domain-containing protein [Paraflavitalea sp. H1-2-19X]
MKILKFVSGSLLLYFLFFSTGTQLSGCSPDPIFDTVYVKDTLILKDTLIVKDTLTIRDTVDCNCYDLKDGLVAWYNFNGGTLKDSSGNNNHIVFNNATTTTGRYGNANSAYLFNGSSSYMRIPNSASLNPTNAITLSAVIKVNGFYNGTCHGNQIIVKTSNIDKDNGLYGMTFNDHKCPGNIDTSKTRFWAVYGDALGANSSAEADTVPVKIGQWYSIVYTYENYTSKFYINGELKQSRKFSAFSFIPNAGDLYFGRMPDQQYPNWLNAAIDDIRIYNRALCDGEVKQLNRVKD